VVVTFGTKIGTCAPPWVIETGIAVGIHNGDRACQQRLQSKSPVSPEFPAKAAAGVRAGQREHWQQGVRRGAKVYVRILQVINLLQYVPGRLMNASLMASSNDGAFDIFPGRPGRSVGIISTLIRFVAKGSLEMAFFNTCSSCSCTRLGHQQVALIAGQLPIPRA